MGNIIKLYLECISSSIIWFFISPKEYVPILFKLHSSNKLFNSDFLKKQLNILLASNEKLLVITLEILVTVVPYAM